MTIRSTMKPRGFVLFAVSLAAWVPGVLALLKWATGSRPDLKAPPPPPPDVWRKLYRRNGRVLKAWGDGIGLASTSPAGRELGSLEEMKAHKMAFPPTWAEVQELFGFVYGDAKPAEVRSMLTSPEGQFLLRVWIPCLVLYREPPAGLLRRARGGDDDAFDDLLRLDKSVISDPVLWRRWHTALNDPKPGRRKRFRDAMGGPPLKRFTEKSIRLAFAGLLSQAAKRFDCEMTAPEIREWFVAFVPGDYLPDQAMPAGEALTRGIHRHRNWPARRRDEQAPGQ